MNSVDHDRYCPRCRFNLSRFRPLLPVEIRILNGLVQGLKGKEIAKHCNTTHQVVRNSIRQMAHLFEIDTNDTWPRIKLAVYWSCPLFRVGLRELGML